MISCNHFNPDFAADAGSRFRGMLCFRDRNLTCSTTIYAGQWLMMRGCLLLLVSLTSPHAVNQEPQSSCHCCQRQQGTPYRSQGESLSNRSLPLASPSVPLVLPSANVPLEELLARVLPDVDAQAREKAFKDMIRSEGSEKAAVALFQSVYNNLIKYPVEGVCSTLPLLQRTKLMSFRPSSPLLASLLGPLI
jgi:hypothetical protein